MIDTVNDFLSMRQALPEATRNETDIFFSWHIFWFNFFCTIVKYCYHILGELLCSKFKCLFFVSSRTKFCAFFTLEFLIKDAAFLHFFYVHVQFSLFPFDYARTQFGQLETGFDTRVAETFL